MILVKLGVFIISIWAIGDLHLAFDTPEKEMGSLFPQWKEHERHIANSWRRIVKDGDLVLIPGDISWSSNFEGATLDLKWIDTLPGEKVILRGNHDYWWPSSQKLNEGLPPTIHFIHNSSFNWHDITIGGSRLWDTDEYSFDAFIELQHNPQGRVPTVDKAQQQKIFERELQRLKLSLEQLSSKARIRIAMTHYPPIGADLRDSRTSKILEEYQIDVCVFGHLHNITKTSPLFGLKNNTQYILVSADYLNFTPTLITPSERRQSP